MDAEIITIGDELLIGQVVDTNSAYMAKELNKIGINVRQITSISDSRRHILATLKEVSERVRLVLITGGLGPTKDDITKMTLAEYTDDRLVVHAETLHRIEAFAVARKLAMNPLNRKQAEVPSRCVVIPNTCGTAPGMWFEKEETVYVSMPGVPFEMKTMMQDEILPRLQHRFNSDAILHRTLLVTGIPESELALKIEDWENNLPADIKLAYLPSGGMIRLRLSTFGSNGQSIAERVQHAVDGLRPILKGHLLSENDELPEELTGRLLAEKGKTVSTAESCTGGNIARLLTSISGSSQYYKGSVVAYDNDVKAKMLHVKRSDIETFGAVSETVVLQMAENVRQLMGTDYGVATSGIAGPLGGTPDKPVGTMWIAVASESRTVTKLLQYGNNRENNIQRASTAVLNLLIEQLQK